MAEEPVASLAPAGTYYGAMKSAQLWGLLVGAGLATASGFLSGWILMKLQARNAENLALRLRAIELQEPVLRALSLRLGKMHESFKHLPDVDEPPQASRNSTQLTEYLGPWHEFRQAVEGLLDSWRTEYARDVIDNVLPAAFLLLQARADDLNRSLGRYANEEASVEDLRKDGRAVLTEVANLRKMADNQARRRGLFK